MHPMEVVKATLTECCESECWHSVDRALCVLRRRLGAMFNCGISYLKDSLLSCVLFQKQPNFCQNGGDLGTDSFLGEMIHHDSTL